MENNTMELKKQLVKIILLTTISVSLAHSSTANDRPFKVCPNEVVTAKDVPCRILGPTAAVAHRMEIPNEDKKKIKELEEKIKILEEENNSLKNNKNKSSVDIDRPTNTRAIRG